MPFAIDSPPDLDLFTTRESIRFLYKRNFSSALRRHFVWLACVIIYTLGKHVTKLSKRFLSKTQ